MIRGYGGLVESPGFVEESFVGDVSGGLDEGVVIDETADMIEKGLEKSLEMGMVREGSEEVGGLGVSGVVGYVEVFEDVVGGGDLNFEFGDVESWLFLR